MMEKQTDGPRDKNIVIYLGIVPGANEACRTDLNCKFRMFGERDEVLRT